MNVSDKQKCVRMKNVVDYLVGDGLFSKIPEVDAQFYYLSGECSSEKWPTNPSKVQSSIKAKETDSSACCCTTPSSNTEHVVRESPAADNNELSRGSSADVLYHTTSLFTPRPNLPMPISRETYRLWKSAMDMNFRFRTLRRRRAAIAIQPLGDFPLIINEFVLVQHKKENISFFELLRQFVAAFFIGTDIKLLPAVDYSDWNLTSRIHTVTNKQQLLAEDVNKGLAVNCLPSDVFAVVGISWTDLYPSAKQNFVLGQAAAEKRSAVVSFGRFETNPGTNAPALKSEDLLAVDSELIWKMFKVIAHETCHLFYFAHCVFFDCLMNDSRSVSEAMSQPLHLCPVCSRKLQKVLRVKSITEHHRSLLAHLSTLMSHENVAGDQLRDEIDWLRRCIAFCEESTN